MKHIMQKVTFLNTLITTCPLSFYAIIETTALKKSVLL